MVALPRAGYTQTTYIILRTLKIKFENTLAFAKKLDNSDPLRSYRSHFFIPKGNKKTLIYFSGHSLGLQPKSVADFINAELKDWAEHGVDGHEHARRPWLYYHKFSKKTLAGIVGAKSSEVVAMNQLTVNLHLLMVSFYKPTRERFKIMMEAGAFSSDQYAVESQLRFHGLDPNNALIEIKPREGEHTLRTEDIEKKIEENASSLALILFGGVQYYTGQFFDIEKITAAGHDVGAIVGFDLAHAVGNVDLHLHKHKVDFAGWCSYKYLNSGPGGLAGIFIHEKHFSQNHSRFAGWWGHQEGERFKMKGGFLPMHGADGWQVSNVPIFQAAAHLASLEIFGKIGMKALRQKSIKLTGYLEFLLKELEHNDQLFNVITPTPIEQRGCQLSLLIKSNGKKIFNFLTRHGVIADWREPNVIRIAPVPLYNSFEDVFRFSKIFESALSGDGQRKQVTK